MSQMLVTALEMTGKVCLTPVSNSGRFTHLYIFRGGGDVFVTNTLCMQ